MGRVVSSPLYSGGNGNGGDCSLPGGRIGGGNGGGSGMGVALALTLADAVYPAAASWKASLAPWGGWFPPPCLAGEMGGGGIAPPRGEGFSSGDGGSMAVVVAVAVV